jgi:hypothetical protein
VTLLQPAPHHVSWSRIQELLLPLPLPLLRESPPDSRESPPDSRESPPDSRESPPESSESPLDSRESSRSKSWKTWSSSGGKGFSDMLV